MIHKLNATGQQRRLGDDGGWGTAMALVAGLVGPFVLWPIEQWLPMPVVVEELYKLWLVKLILRSRQQNGLFWAMAVGLGFGGSETILYLMNFLQSGGLGEWGCRLVTTVPMHVMTTVIQYVGWVVGWGVVGIIPASLLHQWFNSVI